MPKDTQGNDLDSVEVILGGGFSFVPYAAENVITPEMIADNKATPGLPTAYSWEQAGIGLILSDGGPQDARDADDATEFYQPGYTLNSSPTLTTQFSPAENNALVRQLTIGTPDEYGVYHVSDIIQNTKWMAYQEELVRGKNGKTRVRRRAGVVQITNNEPNQSERKSVKGTALTATWQEDPLYQTQGDEKYIESYYEPDDTTTESVSATPTTVTVQEGADVEVTATVLPATAPQTVTAASNHSDIATVTVTGLTVTIHGVAAGTFTITLTAGTKTATITGTVTA
ncbi:hypothetical protein BPY_23310 [Bifidobacterium psychraerophilum]|uniref:Ig-like domain-containing protein n=1 Tax=Bifidobacterium psychraerophilum TaxID=218140 RepID=UPI003111B220